MPLAVTLTVATVGVTAWVWSQRKDEDEEAERGLDYGDQELPRDNQAYGSRDAGTRDVGTRDVGSRDLKGPGKPDQPEEQSHGLAPADDDVAGAGWGARMSGALRRTPSPQQFFDSTGKTVAAGVAAAGAVMGKALASIREEDKYGDNNPWSEEADAKQEKERAPNAASSSAVGGKRRKTVAIVLSADSQTTLEEMETFHEHAVR